MESYLGPFWSWMNKMSSVQSDEFRFYVTVDDVQYISGHDIDKNKSLKNNVIMFCKLNHKNKLIYDENFSYILNKVLASYKKVGIPTIRPDEVKKKIRKLVVLHSTLCK